MRIIKRNKTMYDLKINCFFCDRTIVLGLEKVTPMIAGELIEKYGSGWTIKYKNIGNKHICDSCIRDLQEIINDKQFIKNNDAVVK